MNPTIIIHFDLENWKPTAVYLNGGNNEETAELSRIADEMLAALGGKGNAKV